MREIENIDVVGLGRTSPPSLPGSLQLVPVTRIEKFRDEQGLLQISWRI